MKYVFEYFLYEPGHRESVAQEEMLALSQRHKEVFMATEKAVSTACFKIAISRHHCCGFTVDLPAWKCKQSCNGEKGSRRRYCFTYSKTSKWIGNESGRTAKISRSHQIGNNLCNQDSNSVVQVNSSLFFQHQEQQSKVRLQIGIGLPNENEIYFIHVCFRWPIHFLWKELSS